ncbi:MAG: hypothetical protein PUG16_00470 [Lachnospiraceae bacterium]|nr:hypothetical protein [Lachnospiraceae bacterium]
MGNIYQYEDFDPKSYKWDWRGRRLAESLRSTRWIPAILVILLAVILAYWFGAYLLLDGISPWVIPFVVLALFFALLGIRTIIAWSFASRAGRLPMKGRHDYNLWLYHNELWQYPEAANQVLLSMAAIDILRSEIGLAKQALDQIDTDILDIKGKKLYSLYRLITAIQSGSEDTEEWYKSYTSLTFEKNPFEDKAVFPSDGMVARWVVGNGHVSYQAQEMRDAVRSIARTRNSNGSGMQLFRGLTILLLSLPFLFAGLNVFLIRKNGWYFYPAFGIFGSVISTVILLLYCYQSVRTRIERAATKAERGKEAGSFKTFRKKWKKRKLPRQEEEDTSDQEEDQQNENNLNGPTSENDDGFRDNEESPYDRNSEYDRESQSREGFRFNRSSRYDPDSYDSEEDFDEDESGEDSQEDTAEQKTVFLVEPKTVSYWSKEKIALRRMISYLVTATLVIAVGVGLLLSSSGPFLTSSDQRRLEGNGEDVTILFPWQHAFKSTSSIYQWNFWYLAIKYTGKDSGDGSHEEYFRTADSILMQYWPDAEKLDSAGGSSSSVNAKEKSSSDQSSDESSDSSSEDDAADDSDSADADLDNSDSLDSSDSDAETDENADPVKTSMSLVFQYLKENSSYPNMSLSFGSSAKGDTYATVAKTTENSASTTRQVEYRLYQNTNANASDGQIEIVCEKVYDGALQDAKIEGFYLVDPDTEKVTDEHRTSW